ncbi:Hypothetical predicted protein [Marmota monax]|uniref:Uncharacterized protein n=1 Tax=Marmota monax TaxID=9995 RepID=A0A5E4APA1_MARMO|nr:Hypothetical predicted protein [Marmota monax]
MRTVPKDKLERLLQAPCSMGGDQGQPFHTGDPGQCPDLFMILTVPWRTQELAWFPGPGGRGGDCRAWRRPRGSWSGPRAGCTEAPPGLKLLPLAGSPASLTGIFDYAGRRPDKNQRGGLLSRPSVHLPCPWDIPVFWPSPLTSLEAVSSCSTLGAQGGTYF